uniref:glucose-6-phosphatase n=1 Tax=Hucho hucho TaxID=62062 RepID=A0A4W5QBE8_9TELE
MDLFHSWGWRWPSICRPSMGIIRAGLASTVADLHTTFFCFFPVWFYLCRDKGVKLIWVAAIGDWLNLVLKWVLFGERHYWWVHDTHFYGTDPAPTNVCQSIAMVVLEQGLSVLFIPRFFQVGLWMLLWTVELLVCMSRVYMAAHFPHHVISGVITGVMVAEVFSRVQWIYRASLKKYFYTTLFLLSFAVGRTMYTEIISVDLATLLYKLRTMVEVGCSCHLEVCKSVGLAKLMNREWEWVWEARTPQELGTIRFYLQKNNNSEIIGFKVLNPHWFERCHHHFFKSCILLNITT